MIPQNLDKIMYMGRSSRGQHFLAPNGKFFGELLALLRLEYFRLILNWSFPVSSDTFYGPPDKCP